MKCYWKKVIQVLSGLEPEYLPQRTSLCRAGLSERQLRKMDPDARVAALENANLDPYDYIFLAC